LTALLQVSSPQAVSDAAAALGAAPTVTPTATTLHGQTVLQQALQNGGARLYQASRLGLNLDTKG